MRIISQDGCYDIPYESIILQRLGTSIFGVTTGLQESITIARYRKEEKAEKAMEMCREKYLSRMELDGGYDIVNKCYVQPNYCVLPKAFQFPKEEEV